MEVQCLHLKKEVLFHSVAISWALESLALTRVFCGNTTSPLAQGALSMPPDAQDKGRSAQMIAYSVKMKGPPCLQDLHAEVSVAA